MNYTQGFVFWFVALLSLLMSSGFAGIIQRTRGDGVTAFFVGLTIFPSFATWIVSGLMIRTDTRIMEAAARQNVLTETESVNMPPLIDTSDGVYERLADVARYVELAKIIKANQYRLRARALGADYEDAKQLFGNLDGACIDKGNGVVDLTDYGIWLVDFLTALPPSECKNPSFRVLRRLTHT